MQSIFRLIPAVQHYDWGHAADRSLVFKLAESAGCAHLDPKLRYAELWLGAHAKGTARIAGTDADLKQLIESDPARHLGPEAIGSFGASLPYLLKVLSIKHALSLQAHPDSHLARILHQRDPKNYPDQNAKPELAIALNSVKLLYGFKSVVEVSRLIGTYPALEKVFGAIPQDNHQAAVKGAYKRALEEPVSTRNQAAIKLLDDPAFVCSAEGQLFAALCRQFGADDRGIFCALLLNQILLAPGQAIFVAPNTLHAYLEGDLLECMSSSDNVVRAGLTSKFQDQKTLLKMLDYSCGTPEILVPQVSANGVEVRFYPKKCEEFEVCFVHGNGDSKAVFNMEGSAALIFCLGGDLVIESGAQSAAVNAGAGVFISAAEKSFVLKLRDGRAVMAGVSCPKKGLNAH